MGNIFETGVLGEDEYRYNRELLIPRSELRIDTERHRVFAGLVDVRPEPRDLPLFILQQMLQGKRVIWFGPPGVGKTSAMTQAIASARENAKRIGIVYEPTLAQYDVVLSRSKDKKEGILFNRQLVKAFTNATNCENVGVGDPSFKDRGVNANRQIMKRIAEGIDRDTIMIGMPQVWTNQLYSGYLREEALKQKPEDFFEFMRHHNLLLEGIPQTDEIAAEIIKDYGMMGKREHITQIRVEDWNVISIWEKELRLRAMRESGNSNVVSIIDERAPGLVIPESLTASVISDIYNSFGVESHEQSELAARDAVDAFTAQAIYMEYEFRDHFGIDADRGIVAVNQWHQGPVIQDLSPYMRRRAA